MLFKKGFTMIELLFTTTILGLFSFFIFSISKTILNNYQMLNENKDYESYLDFLYLKECFFDDKEIYFYKKNNQFLIDEHMLFIIENENLVINNKTYNIVVKDIVIEDEFIFFRAKFFYNSFPILIKGEVHEIYNY